MNYGLWLSAAGLQVNEYRQAVLANNLANSETVGFKQDLAVVHERLMESRASAEGVAFGDSLLDGLSGGPWVRPTYHDFAQGELVKTDHPLDVAIQGDGFFTVEVGGERRYTRDGRIVVNEKGELVSVAGGGRTRFLDDAGKPIVVDTRREVTVSTDGEVRQGDAAVAKLGVTGVEDPQTLRKVGQNLFVGVEAKETESESTVQSGFVERSTVDPLESLATMIEVTRAYEANARMISLQDSLLEQVIGRVGRIG